MNSLVEFAFGTRQEPIPLLGFLPWEAVRPRWKQIHGIGVAEVKHERQDCGQVDALWTRVSGLTLGVVTADCVPLLLQRKDGQAVAALHAGWRGILQHLPQAFFSVLPREFSEPAEWQAHIGPCIQECCYEFGAAEIALLQAAYPQLDPSQLSPAPHRLNLLAPLTQELQALGVEILSIHADCTFCKQTASGEYCYFSFRRGDRNSRQYSQIQKLPLPHSFS